MDELEILLREFSDYWEITLKTALESKGYRNSKLYKSISTEYKDYSIQLYCNDYIDYLDRGRKKFTKKVPIKALLQWIKDKRIKGRNFKTGKFISDLQLAFIIQGAIFKNGIVGRGFLKVFYNDITKEFSEYIDRKIIDEMVSKIFIQFKT